MVGSTCCCVFDVFCGDFNFDFGCLLLGGPEYNQHSIINRLNKTESLNKANISRTVTRAAIQDSRRG